ncbi:unnamed protein product [Plutella xylostella]|uniref:(diamondback moth) hypothetical protein n=1 Tax=Plutella xylostella TaxID=51655 RepID=A0A8S4GCI2_PLUXY|nr:unnamed protein product [Plutella xylostella]
MSKRTYEERIDYYNNKIKKYMDKDRRKRRRLRLSSSSDDFPENDYRSETLVLDRDQEAIIETMDPPPDLRDDLRTGSAEPPSEDAVDLIIEPTATATEPPPATDPAVADQPTGAEPTTSTTDVDPDILQALGEATDVGPTFGEEIHQTLCQLWQPLLKKGMSKEAKDKILKQYLVPSNCTLLQAPKLNIEVSATANEMVKSRDKKVESAQQQLGAGITAISRALTTLMTTNNKVEAVRVLSDGCRLLCDLHFMETQGRIKMLASGLTKPFLNVIQDSVRDETLFGNNLSEKIKASNTIEKQGMQIRKTPQPPKATTSSHSGPRPSQFQGNWTGPPRYPYPPSRGGRGGQRRPPPSARRPAPAPATSRPPPPQGRSRVPTRP